MHTTHLEPGSAAPLTLPPGTRPVIARRSVPLFELHVAGEEPLCVTHAQACALLAALQSCVTSPSGVTA